MPPRPQFPRTRHLALSLGTGAATSGAEACSIPLGEAARDQAVPAAAAASKEKPGKGADKQPEPLPRMVRVDLSLPLQPGEACAAHDGTPAGGATPVRCPCSLEGLQHANESARAAARLGDAVLLEGLDRWYALGSDGAGYCASCGAALVERLRESYGEQMLPFDAIAQLKPGAGEKLPARVRPFGGLREALRLFEAVEAGKRAALAARDEGRRTRQLELLVFGRVGALSPTALLLARHLDGLVFQLPSADPLHCLLPLLAAREALGQRPAIALAPAQATDAEVRLLAALATACDCDLSLPEGASPAADAALAAHRAWLRTMKDRLRPAAPLADLVLLASPDADAFTGGEHFSTASLTAAAIARLQLQIAVALELPVEGRAPLVLAGCGGLREDQAAAARRHLAEGGDLLLVGPCAVLDEEGRSLGPLFADVKAGLNRLGTGRIWAVAPSDALPAPAALELQIGRAVRELLGRGRAQLTLTGRGSLLVRGYLDPERKLDLHLVNLDLGGGGAAPAQGMTLHLAGQIAGGGRSGYWFAPDRDKGEEGERIALNAAGFGVSTVLPRLGSSALLTIPR